MLFSDSSRLQEIHCFLRLPCKSGVFDFINGLAYWHVAEKQRKNRPANVEQLLLCFPVLHQVCPCFEGRQNAGYSSTV